MNTKTMVLAAAALALGAAVPSLLGGYVWGVADTEVLTKCTVEDKELALHERGKVIDAELEKKIDLKTRILSDVGYLKATKQELTHEIQQLDAERLRLSVKLAELQRRQAALEAL